MGECERGWRWSKSERERERAGETETETERQRQRQTEDGSDGEGVREMVSVGCFRGRGYKVNVEGEERREETG